MSGSPAPHIIQVWRAFLDDDAGAQRDAAVLSADEQHRAARFHFDRDRNRFIVAHAFVRRVLAGCLDLDPAAIQFRAGPHGKPFIAAPPTPLQFNLSHSHAYALLAISDGRSVGVDIERVGEIEHDLIADYFFSPAEASQLHGTAAGEKARAFANCWTRKEAYIKATGVGVTEGLDHFDVAFTPGRPARLLADRRDPDWTRWTMADLPAPAGYAAAIVVEGADWTLTTREFT